jgi:hypothetical protein
VVHIAPQPVPAQKARAWEPDERPHASADARIHPLTLRFAPALEKQFASDYFERTMGHVRLALLLAFALYSVFGVLDAWIAPSQRNALWFIRYAVFGPAVLACLWFTYSPTFKRHRDRTLSVVVLIGSLGIVVMTSIIPPPGSYLYYAGLLLALMFTFTLFRLMLPYATGITLIVIGGYIVVVLWLNPTPTTLVINNLFFLVSAEVIGFGSGYSMERYARTNFLQRRLIETRTRELETRTREIEERNEELLVKNQMLAESRAETLRTVRRSELMFAALSEALPGTVLDNKYRIAEKIGAGNFGTVYRGEHIFLHHPVAIKVFRPAVGSGALEGLDRFRREGISACRINHPNAVTVLDFDVSAGSLAYLVMELLQGRSLADELKTSPKLRPERCARIAASVCDALAEAHAAGIVHRDIKPTNVFLHHGRGEELVKVIDFGIAKLTQQDPGEPPTLTLAGEIVGTPAYIAPERLNGDPYDGRADVYAVGVMLYEMLSGRLPFQSGAGSHWSLAIAQLGRQAPAPSTIEPDVPAALDALVLDAMAREPDQRPTAAVLGAALREWSLPS